jgi:hypothetical protein
MSAITAQAHGFVRLVVESIKVDISVPPEKERAINRALQPELLESE